MSSPTPMETNNCTSVLSCEKLDRMANWVGSNVASAFFASLERCSCIHLSTNDFDDDVDNPTDDHPKDQLPLLLSTPTQTHSDESELHLPPPCLDA